VADYVPTFIGSVMKHIACTPNKNFDEAAYDRGVIEPASRIRKLQEILGEERPSDLQMREVMALLLTIFETKFVDMEEREDRVRETLDRLECHDVFPNLLPLPEGLSEQFAQLGLEPDADPLAEIKKEGSADAAGPATDETDAAKNAGSSADADLTDSAPSNGELGSDATYGSGNAAANEELAESITSRESNSEGSKPSTTDRDNDS